MRVAVLGGSNGGYATAADLALAGQQVRLWRRDAAALTALGTPPVITFRGDGVDRAARLEKATGDLGEAMEGADVVVVPLPATSHEDLAPRLGRHFTGQEIVLLTPGTLGSYVMAREIARAGGRMPLAFAETGTLPYLARKTGPAEVAAPVRAANLPVGVFPSARSDAALARVRELFPATRPCVDALDVALTNAGIVIHPPLVLLNAGAIDRGRFDIHAAGTTDSPRRMIEAVDAERVATREGWGYPAPHYEIAMHYDEARAAEWLYGAGARAKLTASGLWNEVLTYEHRYVTEDVALGLPLFESAARAAGTPSDAVSGLLSVFGTLLGRRLTGQGRALERLGLGDLSRREIRGFLQEGWTSSFWRGAIA